MKIPFSRYLSFLSLLLILVSGGCVSTSTEEPASTDETTGADEIAISISGDNVIPGITRAEEENLHEGYQLRYTAKLYTQVTVKPNVQIYTDGSNLVQTIEQLASDGNRVIFKNVEDGKYFVTIFADYVENGVTKDENGHYPDKYYSTPGGSKAQKITYIAKDEERFNNHNLDCFVLVSAGFTKEQNKGVEITQPLKRAVTRVKVVDTGGSLEAVKNVKIDKVEFTNQYDYTNGTSVGNDVSSKTVSVADRTQNLLFFYYTFAKGDSQTSSTASSSLTFTLNPEEGYDFKQSKWTVQEQIHYTPNRTYTVSGNLSLTSKVPGGVAKLNVKVDKEWNESEKSL